MTESRDENRSEVDVLALLDAALAQINGTVGDMTAAAERMGKGITDGLMEQIVAPLIQERDEALRERDLAVAHDRQPYPTAWAYEQACRVMREAKAERDDAQTALAVVREQIEALARHYELSTDEFSHKTMVANRVRALAAAVPVTPPNPQPQPDECNDDRCAMQGPLPGAHTRGEFGCLVAAGVTVTPQPVERDLLAGYVPDPEATCCGRYPYCPHGDDGQAASVTQEQQQRCEHGQTMPHEWREGFLLHPDEGWTELSCPGPVLQQPQEASE